MSDEARAVAGRQGLLELLRLRIGLAPQSSAAQQLLSTLAGRSGAELMQTLAEARLNPAALDALVARAVVSETWFFRDAAALAALADAVRQRPRSASPYRVLCAPCATGEEAYSIAASLQAAGLQPGQYDVLALDIAASAVAQARQGHYSSAALRDLPAAERGQLFEPDGPPWRVRAVLRRGLRFDVANLLDEPDPALHGQFDAVFCRHLLIYLDADARQRLARWLRLLAVPGDGLIFVGPAEAAGAFGGALQPLDRPCSFGFRNRERARHTARHAAAARPPPATSASAAPAPPLTLAAVEALADRGDLAAAWAAAQALVAVRALDPDAHALLGLLAETRGDAALARRSYLSALYLAPQHRASLHHLLLMAQAAGDRPEAERLRLRLGRAAAEQPL